jgi:anti-sigma B factor antagonist
LRIAKHRRPDGSALLVVAGDVDISTSSQLRDAGLEVIRAEPSVRLVIDLMDVTFLDSTGIGALLELRNAASTADGSVVLLDPSENVMRVLDITRLSDVIDIERTGQLDESASNRDESA